MTCSAAQRVHAALERQDMIAAPKRGTAAAEIHRGIARGVHEHDVRLVRDGQDVFVLVVDHAKAGAGHASAMEGQRSGRFDEALASPKDARSVPSRSCRWS